MTWGFDVNCACEFAGAAVDSGPWHAEIETLLLQEKFETALEQLEGHLSTAKKSNDDVGEAAALHALARAHCTLHDCEKANQVAQLALERYRSANSVKGIAGVLLVQAKIAMDAQENDNAEAFAAKALEKYQAVGCRVGEGAVHHTLARIHMRKGDHEDTFEECSKALEKFEKAGDKEGKAAILIVKGNCLCWGFRDGQEEACKLGREAAAICRKVVRPVCRHREAEAQFLMANASLQMQKFRDGLKAAKESITLLQEFGGPLSLASAMRAASVGHMQCGNVEEAEKSAAETLSLLQSQQTDPTMIAEAMAVDAMVHRHKYSAGNCGEDNELVHKARGVLEAFVKLGDEHAVALHRLELAQSLFLIEDSAAALTEATISLEFFEDHDVKELQGMCLLLMARCLHQTGDAKAALDKATKSEKLLADPASQNDVAQLMAILKREVRRTSGPTWKNTSQWEEPDTKVEMPSTHQADAGGVKRATYSDLIHNRLQQTGDTPEPIAFDAQNVMFMDAWLGIHMPFLPTEKPAIPGQPPVAAPASSGSQPIKSGNQDRSLVLAADIDGERRRPAVASKPTGPVIVKPRIVGDDFLGGRHRDCPDDLHNRMVMLVRSGALPPSTTAKRSELQKRKPTFHGDAEWREASRWGYICPPDMVPRGCKWLRMSVGWKLIGPSPQELLSSN